VDVESEKATDITSEIGRLGQLGYGHMRVMELTGRLL
jgi:hypothetical protein